MAVLAHLCKRVVASFTTLPPPNCWGPLAAVLAASTSAGLLFGFGTGFLRYNPVRDVLLVIKGTCMALITPSLIEELFFRILPLPHPMVDGPMNARRFAAHSIAPLVLFITYHLINPRKQSRAVFYDYRFLVLAGILGAACSAGYYYSAGCAWVPVVLHWLPVCGWLFALDGYQKLQYSTEYSPLATAVDTDRVVQR